MSNDEKRVIMQFNNIDMKLDDMMRRVNGNDEKIYAGGRPPSHTPSYSFISSHPIFTPYIATQDILFKYSK